MNDKVYLHEYIDIILQGRAKYFEHMTAGWAKYLAHNRPMRCFGVWGTLGSTARWPEVINLWEYDGWDAIAEVFRIEADNPHMQDADLVKWWGEAAKYRSGGFDRILVPAAYSPTIEQVCKDKNIVGAKVFYHERIQVAPGQAKTYLSMLEDEWLAPAKQIGLHLTGAYRTAMRNDSEVFLIWAIRDWQTWANVEKANDADPRVATWRRRTQGMAIDWLSHCMVSAPLSPTQIGKQPTAS
jgi:hypothetical protein